MGEAYEEWAGNEIARLAKELKEAKAKLAALENDLRLAKERGSGGSEATPDAWTQEAWDAISAAIPESYGSGNMGVLVERVVADLLSLCQFEEDVRGWSKSDGRLLEHLKAACDSLDERRSAAALSKGGSDGE